MNMNLHDSASSIYKVISAAVEMAASPFVLVDDVLIKRTIKRAQHAPFRRARVLLHPGQEDLLHEMLIALPQESCDVPHINFKSGKSFHIVQGEMVVMIFNNDGTHVTPCRLKSDDSSCNKMIRLNQAAWHTIIPLSEYAVFVETILGPFVGNQFAPWSPKQIDVGEGPAFRNRLRSIAQTTVELGNSMSKI